MCDCESRVHPGIECDGDGCICHKGHLVASVWLRDDLDGFIINVSEDHAQRMAEDAPGIYFFAELTPLAGERRG